MKSTFSPETVRKNYLGYHRELTTYNNGKESS